MDSSAASGDIPPAPTTTAAASSTTPSSSAPTSSTTNDVPQKPDPDQEQITLRVVAQDGTEIYFKIKQNTPLRKLMGAYCNKLGKDPNSVRFMFNGQRILDEQTPAAVRISISISRSLDRDVSFDREPPN